MIDERDDRIFFRRPCFALYVVADILMLVSVVAMVMSFLISSLYRTLLDVIILEFCADRSRDMKAAFMFG